MHGYERSILALGIKVYIGLHVICAILHGADRSQNGKQKKAAPKAPNLETHDKVGEAGRWNVRAKGTNWYPIAGITAK